MKNFQMISTFDWIPLLVEIMQQPELWKVDTYLRDYPQGPFEDVETIFLRFPPVSVSELERRERDPHECVWMDGAVHLPAARPLIFGLMSRVQGERLGRVMINKVRCGGRIYAHADTAEHAEYWERYHLVLKTAPGCNFRAGAETIHMPVGSVWWFENALEHEVVNNSVDERIHMIVDIRSSHIDVVGATPTRAIPVAQVSA